MNFQIMAQTLENRGNAILPSTGKSSNSSSSSNAAAGFCWSFIVEESVVSEVVALVVGPEPSAAADIVARAPPRLIAALKQIKDWTLCSVGVSLS